MTGIPGKDWDNGDFRGELGESDISTLELRRGLGSFEGPGKRRWRRGAGNERGRREDLRFFVEWMGIGTGWLVRVTRSDT